MMTHPILFALLALSIVGTTQVEARTRVFPGYDKVNPQRRPNAPVRRNPVQTDKGEPKLAPPPALASLPQGSQWTESTKKDIDKALKNYADDQVSTYVAFRDLIRKSDDKKEKADLTTDQRKWLQDSLTLLKPRAIAVLNRDINMARARQDFRGAFIASLTLLTVTETNDVQTFDDFMATLPKVADLMKESFKAKGGSRDVWQITDATGDFLASYSEGFYPSQTIVTPDKEGFRILRVRAKVKNVSLTSDPSYIPGALNFFKRMLLVDDRDEIKKPSRLAGDTFIYVVNAEYTKSFPVGYITKYGNPVLRNALTSLLGEMITSGGRTEEVKLAGKALQKLHPGSFVEQGEEFDIDVLFPVPKDSDEFQLVIIGSPPVPIKTQSQ